RAAALGIDGNDELGILAVIARKRAGIVAGVEVEAILDPLLLHELELPEQAGADADEDDAVIAAVIGIAAVLGAAGAVGQAAPQDAAAVVQRRARGGLRILRPDLRVEHVAGVGAADMGGHRAFEAVRIVAVAEIVDLA